MVKKFKQKNPFPASTERGKKRKKERIYTLLFWVLIIPRAVGGSPGYRSFKRCKRSSARSTRYCLLHESFTRALTFPAHDLLSFWLS